MLVPMTVQGEKEVLDIVNALAVIGADLAAGKGLVATALSDYQQAVIAAQEAQAAVADAKLDPHGSVVAALVGVDGFITKLLAPKA